MCIRDRDTVIMSLGTSPNPLLKATTPGLETQKRGQIIADEHGLTSRSEEHTSELQSLMRISYAVFCLHPCWHFRHNSL